MSRFKTIINFLPGACNNKVIMCRSDKDTKIVNILFKTSIFFHQKSSQQPAKNTG